MNINLDLKIYTIVGTCILNFKLNKNKRNQFFVIEINSNLNLINQSYYDLSYLLFSFFIFAKMNLVKIFCILRREKVHPASY